MERVVNPSGMAQHWALEDVVSIVRRRMEREAVIARNVANAGIESEWFRGYAEGIMETIQALEEVLRDFRRGRL